MGSFLKTIFATIVGVFVAFALIVVVAIGMLVTTASKIGSAEEQVQLKDNTVLVLKFDKPVSEVANDLPWDDFPLPFTTSNGTLGLHKLRNAISQAKTDDKVAGILLEGGQFQGGFGIETEVREALEDFKKSGKFIYSYANNMSEGGYYLNSIADEIYLNPAGNIELNGLSVELQYFKDFFAKIGVEPEVFRVGKYKSAVEPFITDKMSDANREQISAYLNSMYDYYLDVVAASRNIDRAELKRVSDEMLVRNPDDALKSKLVTQVAYRNKMMEDLKVKLGQDAESKLNLLTVEKFMKSLKADKSHSSNKIAVLVCEGDIVDGKGQIGQIGGDDIADRLRKLREDDDVKAVVLRVNSPGGSALASDIMWHEVQLMKEKKPIIASMSSYAASGGYYMSMGCDKIVALPNTITGSIGIFGLALNPSNLFEDKMGINTYAVSTGKYSNFMSLLDDFTEEEKSIIQQNVNEGYERFTSKAAAGRNMSKDALLEIAQGRVWTGADAIRIGLVDKLGGIEQAIVLAAEQAEVGEDYEVEYIPKEKNLLESLFEDLADDYTEYSLKNKLGPMYEVYKQMELAFGLQGVNARLPYTLDIK
ncbi:signal peptide peptidase SppA [Limibacter armeniacum]|uniref:signal peptide peptidase SppA n=1 Tax=Limibacter armeniacum TaxID=466084 RepID=UPI002FE5CF42